MAALRDLCHAMVERAHEPDLGIEGFPAEMGLYLTVLKPFGLHREIEPGKFDFAEPDDSQAGLSLRAAWEVIANAGDARLDEIYREWAKPPYGIKAGVMLPLTLAYLMANRDRVAVYIDGTFQTAFDDVFVDKLRQKGADVRIRRIDRSVREAAFLSGLAALLKVEHDGAALPVAQALFQRFEALPTYALRTMSVGEDAALLRSVVVKSADPEALLFDDLPEALEDRLSPEPVFDALCRCEGAYGRLLEDMRLALARALGTDPETFSGLAARAEAVKGMTNNLGFDAMAMRAAAFEQGEGDIEGLVSVLIHKPAAAWSDRDRDQALTEMAAFGRRFRELEALAVVRNRRSDTEAVALVVGVDPLMPALLHSFELTEAEKKEAADLAVRVLDALGKNSDRLQLAALARAVAMVAADAETEAEAA
jgi:hypothetical protein